jgi:hypothetical protein
MFRLRREKPKLDAKRVVPLGLVGRGPRGGFLAFPFLPSACGVRLTAFTWITSDHACGHVLILRWA